MYLPYPARSWWMSVEVFFLRDVIFPVCDCRRLPTRVRNDANSDALGRRKWKAHRILRRPRAAGNSSGRIERAYWGQKSQVGEGERAMPGSNDNVRGVVHGRVIHLETDIGLPDGQEVTVSVQPLTTKGGTTGEGFRLSAGAWADDADGLDAYLQENRRARQLDRPGIEQ